MNETSKKAIDMLKNGGISNHKLSSTARLHTGEEEQEEVFLFRDFLVTKNGCLVMSLEEANIISTSD